MGGEAQSAAEPLPPRLRDFARAHVGRLRLRFDLFRRDHQRACAAAVESWRDGQITREEAQALFIDADEAISGPLVQRYIEARECGKVADWLRSRPGFRLPGWLTQRNRAALDGFVAQGEAALAVQLIRQHLNKAVGGVRAHRRSAMRARPAGLTGEEAARFDAEKQAGLRDLPGHIAIALMELAELEHWVEGHGSPEDRRALAKMRGEIEKLQARFDLQ